MAQRPRIRTTPSTFLLEVPRLGPTARSVSGVIVFLSLVTIGVVDLLGYFGRELPVVLAGYLLFLGALIVAARLLWLHSTTVQIEGDRKSMVVTIGPFARTFTIATDDLVLRMALRLYGGRFEQRVEPRLVVETGSKNYSRMAGRTRATIEQVIDEWETWRDRKNEVE